MYSQRKSQHIRLDVVDDDGWREHDHRPAAAVHDVLAILWASVLSMTSRSRYCVRCHLRARNLADSTREHIGHCIAGLGNIRPGSRGSTGAPYCGVWLGKLPRDFASVIE